MSRLYGSLKGQAKTTATRRANKSIECHVRGWDSGIEVEGTIGLNGEPIFKVWLTGGSNSPAKEVLLAKVNGKVLDRSIIPGL